MTGKQSGRLLYTCRLNSYLNSISARARHVVSILALVRTPLRAKEIDDEYRLNVGEGENCRLS